MIWVILIAIIVIACAMYVKKSNTATETKKPIEPPSGDVVVLGCCASVDCGYYNAEVIRRSDGEFDLNFDVCYCAYQNKKVPRGASCPFAKEHPELLGKGVFDD